MRFGKKAGAEPGPVASVLAVVTSPLWLPAAGLLVLLVVIVVKGTDLKRRWLGPTKEWQRWFAWFPVRTDRGFGKFVWLERVQRRDFWGRIEHRSNEEAA